MGNESLLHFNSDDSDPEQWARWMNIGPVPSPKEDDECGELPKVWTINFEKQTKMKAMHFHESKVYMC